MEKEQEIAVLEAALQIMKENSFEAVPTEPLVLEVSSRCSSFDLSLQEIATLIGPAASVLTTIGYIENRLAEQSRENSLQNSSVQLPGEANGVNFICEDIMELLGEKGIVTQEYLLKFFDEKVKEAGVDWETIFRKLEENGNVARDCQFGWQLFSDRRQNLKPRRIELAKRILDENRHRPFSIETLANRLGFPVLHTEKMLMDDKIEGLFPWVKGEVWSLIDFKPDHYEKNAILGYCRHFERLNKKIKLDHTFWWFAKDKVGMERISEIPKTTKQKIADKMFNAFAIDLRFDKSTEAYVKREKAN